MMKKCVWHGREIDISFIHRSTKAMIPVTASSASCPETSRRSRQLLTSFTNYQQVMSDQLVQKRRLASPVLQ